ncbi:MAG: winged helix-turn-helix domain-containing protein [Chitinophagales bacterium]
MKLKGLEAQLNRRQTIINLHEKGMKQVDIAEVVDVVQPYVSKIIRAYKQGGRKAIQPSKAKGAIPKITNEQLKELENILDQGAENYGFEGEIWNCGRVQRVIKEKFAIDYCTQHVGRILKKLTYTRQKPQLEDYRKNPEKVQEWKEEKLPSIKKSKRRKSNNKLSRRSRF